MKLDSVVTPIRLSAELDGEVQKVSEQVNLTKQATMRLSIERGLPVLLRALGKKPMRKDKKARVLTGAVVPA